MFLYMSRLEFAEWLNNQMLDRGLTAAELSKLGNMDQSTVWRISKGERSVGLDSVVGIAKGLRLSPIEVFTIAIGYKQDPRTADQERLLHQYDLLSEADKTHLMNYIDFLLSKQG
jgi:transcriptional regulator with XRE-family HTH domain